MNNCRGQGCFVTPETPPTPITVLPKWNFRVSIRMQILEAINISTKDHRKLIERKHIPVRMPHIYSCEHRGAMLDSPDCNLKGMNWGAACLETGYSPKGNFTNQFRDHNSVAESGGSPAGLVLAP